MNYHNAAADGGFAPEIVRLPIPHVYRTPAGMSEDEYVAFGIRQLEQALVAQVDPMAVAAMIVEPIQGEAGFVPVPPRFLARIRELCSAHGIFSVLAHKKGRRPRPGEPVHDDLVRRAGLCKDRRQRFADVLLPVVDTHYGADPLNPHMAFTVSNDQRCVNFTSV